MNIAWISSFLITIYTEHIFFETTSAKLLAVEIQGLIKEEIIALNLMITVQYFGLQPNNSMENGKKCIHIILVIEKATCYFTARKIKSSWGMFNYISV
jgi:hypothetical protein